MAITVDVKLNELEKGSGNYSVTATFVDDSKPQDEQETIVNDIQSTRVDTPEQKKHLWDEILMLYDIKVAAVMPTAAVEAEGKAYLEKEL